MNHSMRLSMFNNHVLLKMHVIVETRFALAITILQRFKKIKRGLYDLVIRKSRIYIRRMWERQGLWDKILDDIRWDKIQYIISFIEPIYNMLWSADTEKRNLHLIYDMWDCMIEKVKVVIYKKEGKRDDEEPSFYSVVHSILVDQYNKSNITLHCLAHSLNPK